MHSLPNKNTVRRYRFSAFLVIVKWLLVGAGVPLLCYAMMFEKRELVLVAIAGFGLAGMFSIGHWLWGARARCPLCFEPSFSHQQQAKSWKAKRFLGSYRFVVALGVIFKGCFQCPYCGEETAMLVRHSRRR